MYRNAAISVPVIVALGIVRFGFLILSAGIVADSNPRNAQSVKAAVAVIAENEVSLLIFNGIKCFASK